MRVRVDDPDDLLDLVGFLQRSRCIALADGQDSVEVHLAFDEPPLLAEAELSSYLTLWERVTPGGKATILEREAAVRRARRRPRPGRRRGWGLP